MVWCGVVWRGVVCGGAGGGGGDDGAVRCSAAC